MYTVRNDEEYRERMREAAKNGDWEAMTAIDIEELEQRIETLNGRFEVRRQFTDDRMDSFERLTKSRLECHARHILDTEKKVDTAVKMSVVSVVLVVLHIVIELML